MKKFINPEYIWETEKFIPSFFVMITTQSNDSRYNKLASYGFTNRLDARIRLREVLKYDSSAHLCRYMAE